MFYSRHGKRQNEPELMDDPTCDRETLFRTLRQFERINLLVTPNRSLANALIVDDMQNGEPRRLLDVGAGGGDFARWIVDRAREEGKQLSVVCIDPDRRVCDYCVARCRDYPEIETRCSGFREVDERFDYVFSNHVLHHLSEAETLALLNHTRSITTRLLLISDLRRVRWAEHGFRLLAGVAFRNSFALADGIASIRRAYRFDELASIVAESAWGGIASVQSGFPARLTVTARVTQPVQPARVAEPAAAAVCPKDAICGIIADYELPENQHPGRREDSPERRRVDRPRQTDYRVYRR